MTSATVLSVVLVRQALLTGLDDRIDDDLVQESRELRRLADGVDPETGGPFGTDVRRIFDVFLERNVPARYEAFLTFVGGDLYLRSRNVLPYRLDQDPDLVARWANVSESVAGAADTPGGTVRYLAVPLRSGGRAEGVFVAAMFRDLEADVIRSATRAGAFVGIAAVLIGSVAAFVMTRRILKPVQAVEATARSISETDLSRRIEVRGDDEIAHLARTFNDLLDRLETAFTAQRAFVDDAGHELRTPITIIRGQLETLGDDPEQRARAIDLVTGELDRMGRMVNDLLLLAKAQQPEFLELDLVDVGSLTREVHQKVEALADRRWVVDEVAEGAIVGDRQRLEQAVIQLAQNAAEHTDLGAEIGLGSKIDDGWATLWVRDTGPGIPVDQQDRIFERFARSGVRRAEGAGLGLAIVRAIAERHRGRAGIRSQVGEGATFFMQIPVEHHPSGSGPA